jgi:hypothetical protein
MSLPRLRQELTEVLNTRVSHGPTNRSGHSALMVIIYDYIWSGRLSGSPIEPQVQPAVWLRMRRTPP